MESVKYGFIINGQFGHGHPEGYDASQLPVIDDIIVEGLKATNVSRLVQISGLRNSPFTNIHLSNIFATFDGTEKRRVAWEKKAWDCFLCSGTYRNVTPLPDPTVCPCITLQQ